MNVFPMKYIKLLIFSFSFVSISYSSTINLEANQIGKAIPEALFKSKKPGLITGNKDSKALATLHLKRLNDLFKKKQQEIKAKEQYKATKEVSNKEYFVVAKVGNDIITNIDILNTIKFLCFASNQHYDKNCAKLIINAVLDSLIDNSIRKQFAELQEIPMDEKLIDDKIEEIAKSNNKTVEALSKAFEEAGINMTIFRKNLQSKLLLTMFYQMMEKSINVSEKSLQQYKSKCKHDIKEARYKVCEIFLRVDNIKDQERIKKQAQDILELLKKGFKFSLLAEHLSTNGSVLIDTLEWKTSKTLQKQVLDIIKYIKIGSCSDIIKLKNGYKIVFLLDKAEPNKSGQSETTYNVITGEIPIEIISQEEYIKLQNEMRELSEADSIIEFKEVCNKYGVKNKKESIKSPNIIQEELIKRNKATGKTGILRIDENSPIQVLFVESESVPKASIPNDEQLRSILLQKKALQTFNKNMKKIRSQINIIINEENLNKVLNVIKTLK